LPVLSVSFQDFYKFKRSVLHIFGMDALVAARNAREALEGLSSSPAQTHHEDTRAFEAKFMLHSKDAYDMAKGERDRQNSKMDALAFLVVLKSPPGETMGSDWQIAGKQVFPMLPPPVGKASCFTFGRV
jgi:hypothetical protein